MRPLLVTAAVAINAAAVLAALAPRPASAADAAPAKLDERVVKIKVHDAKADGPDRAVQLVRLPPGKIVLTGADGKATEHAVKPIWIARHETRWAEYDVFWKRLYLAPRERVTRVEERPRPYYPPDGGPGGHRRDDAPVNCAHFEAAVKYCAWLSRHTGKKFRLPTEAEWEYACRAGGGPVKPDAKALGEVAWFWDNSDDKPHPAGTKAPNAWGLYDMLGNVGEFVVRDPKDAKGLLAGGSYQDEATDVHGGAREPYSPKWQKDDPQLPADAEWLYGARHVGFRVVMEDDGDDGPGRR
jgi:formylglycine-generating enzyme required for sulfatase activity